MRVIVYKRIQNTSIIFLLHEHKRPLFPKRAWCHIRTTQTWSDTDPVISIPFYTWRNRPILFNPNVITSFKASSFHTSLPAITIFQHQQPKYDKRNALYRWVGYNLNRYVTISSVRLWPFVRSTRSVYTLANTLTVFFQHTMGNI